MKSYREAKFEFGKAYCLAVLELTHGNVSRAAGLADVNRTDFYNLLRRYGVHGAGVKGRPAVVRDEAQERRPSRYIAPSVHATNVDWAYERRMEEALNGTQAGA